MLIFFQTNLSGKSVAKEAPMNVPILMQVAFRIAQKLIIFVPVKMASMMIMGLLLKGIARKVCVFLFV